MPGIRSFMGGLLRDRSGNVMIYTAVTASVLIGMVGLVIDGSRAMLTHSEAEAAADAAALAAASQLDGSANAFTRATNAAQGTLVQNAQHFSKGGAGTTGGKVEITGIRFLSGLPASDASPITGDYVTDKPSEARYVEVTTEVLTNSNSLLRVVGAAATNTYKAAAVAGFNTSICKVAPMYLCNPADLTTPGAPFTPSDVIGKSFDLWAKNGGGDFGLLEFPGCGNGGKCYRDTMASAAPDGCFGPTVDTIQGNKAGNVEKGVDVRFDDGASASEPSDTNIAPYPITQSSWDCASYWNTAHGVGAAGQPAWCTSNASGVGHTRHDMYQYEKTNPPKADYTRSGSTAKADRRIMYYAVLNCKENGLSEDIPVEAYVKGLLLQPTDKTGSDKHVWLEAIDVVRPGPDDGVLRDDVQLYR